MSAINSAEDARFMELAFTLGRRGLGNAWPNPAVGVVVVRDGVLVGRGWTQPGGRPHAEVEALRRAGPAARGATLYATLEPCAHHGKTPPCIDAIIAAGIARVVATIDDPNPQVAGAGYTRLREHGIAVTAGLNVDMARRVHCGHIRRIRDARPHVMLKLAVSADGKAGLRGRRPAAITAEPARERVQLLRAMSDAIAVGIGTVFADDPLLTCRLPGMTNRSPVRVVLDRDLRLPLESQLIHSATQVATWVVAARGDATIGKEQTLRERGIDIMRVDAWEGGVDLAAMLKAIAARGITRLMVEGGPRLAAALIKADLIDEAWLFHSPDSIGPDGIDALDDLPLSVLIRSPHLRRVGEEAIGRDRLETFERM